MILSLSFFFTDTATTEIYTLSLHDALPIFSRSQSSDRTVLTEGRGLGRQVFREVLPGGVELTARALVDEDRKSTRLNSSHVSISYAVFCLKKKNSIQITASHNTKVRRLALS